VSPPKLLVLPTVQSQVQLEIVSLLKEFLHRAERGELVSISVVGIMAAGGAAFAASSRHKYELVGVLEEQKLRILTGYGEDEEEEEPPSSSS